MWLASKTFFIPFYIEKSSLVSTYLPIYNKEGGKKVSRIWIPRLFLRSYFLPKFCVNSDPGNRATVFLSPNLSLDSADRPLLPNAFIYTAPPLPLVVRKKNKRFLNLLNFHDTVIENVAS